MSRQVATTLPDDPYDWIKQQAQRRKSTIAQVVRELLAKAIRVIMDEECEQAESDASADKGEHHIFNQGQLKAAIEKAGLPDDAEIITTGAKRSCPGMTSVFAHQGFLQVYVDLEREEHE